jgi:hypothetical protein
MNAVEELHKKMQAEKEKVQRKNGTGQLQKYGTIYVGDGRLKAIVRNEACKCIEVEYQAKQAVFRLVTVWSSLDRGLFWRLFKKTGPYGPIPPDCSLVPKILNRTI